MARMIVADHEYVSKRYNLQKLKEVEELVAEAVQVCSSVNLEPMPGANYRKVNIPFNNPITGFCVSTSSLHAKTVLTTASGLYS